MSHSANTISTHRLHPSKELTERTPEWEIHIGMTGMLYVVGPGPRAMLRVSRRQSEEMLVVARDAVFYLNQTRREDTEAGANEIFDALVKCGWSPDDF